MRKVTEHDITVRHHSAKINTATQSSLLSSLGVWWNSGD